MADTLPVDLSYMNRLAGLAGSLPDHADWDRIRKGETPRFRSFTAGKG